VKIVTERELCDFDTYILAERSNRFPASKIKREETERCAWSAKGKGAHNGSPDIFL
jgi:hypothetical protein